MNNIIELISQPAVVTAIVGFFAWLVARMFVKKPDWQKYEGIMINAVKMAEKIIPDDSTNKAALRADQALKIFIQQYKKVYSTEPDIALVQDVQANLPLVHDVVDAEGNLTKPELLSATLESTAQ